MSDEKEGMRADLVPPARFSVSQRIEHFVLATSFTVLGLTGLIQKYGLNSTSEWLIELLGGIEMTRILHRAAAIVFTVQSIYHALVVAYKFFVPRVRMTMMPAWKDVGDGLQSLRFSLSLSKAPPKMPRYNFGEKLEYWALIWGGLIMIVTGFMLWNPLITSAFLPGQFIPAAKAAHGGEAVLAVLAIIVWHFYNVHLKMFNKSMFTGKLTRHQMEEEHGAEWDEFLQGIARPQPAAGNLRRRRMVFMPVAVIAAAMGAGGVYWAATAETTAIATLPVPVSRTAIYSPQKPSIPASTRAAAIPAPPISHPISGREKCFMCHGRSGAKPMPENHEGRPMESCRICHKLGPSPKRAEPTSEKGTIAGPKPVPHPTEGPYKDCRTCHDLGKIKPFPANHANVTTCRPCHK